MDWKYKHFHQERVFAASRDFVIQAARAYMADSLAWQVTDTAEGLSAKGTSFTHAGIANFRMQSVGKETKVEVELLVERASPTGFMLFDVGGYYNIQIRKWLAGIQTIIQVTAPHGTGPV